MTTEHEFNKSNWLKESRCPFCGVYESSMIINSFPHTERSDHSYVVERQCDACGKIFVVIYDAVDCESLE